MRIYLIRHGKTKGNSFQRYIGTTDEPLLPQEKKRLENCVYPKVDLVISSPLIRCQQTARAIYGDRELILCPELRECDFGIFENKNWKELADEPLYQEWVDHNGKSAFPGGEHPEEFKKRSCAVFEKAVKQLQEQKIETAAMVVHGGTIMSIMERYARPEKEFYQWHVSNGNGYELKIRPEQWKETTKEVTIIKSIKTEAVS